MEGKWDCLEAAVMENGKGGKTVDEWEFLLEMKEVVK